MIDATDRRHRLHGRPVPLPAAIGLSLAAPVLLWWVVGPLGRTLPEHEYGPYRVSLSALRAVGLAAVALAAFAVAHLVAVVLRGQPPRNAIAIRTTACLVAAGMVAAGGWRVLTAGANGDSIGAAGVILLGPALVAGLLVGAVRIERSARSGEMPRARLLTTLAILTAPALFGAMFAIGAYDASVGVIDPQQYAAVRVGDPQAQTFHALGRPGDDYDWFFAPKPRNTQCNYYSGDGTREYQICYRDGAVIRKSASDHPVDD